MSKYVIDLRLVKDKELHAVALIEAPNGEEIDVIDFSSPYMTKSGVAHSTLDKAAKVVAEHGGKHIHLRTNFLPLHRDFARRRNNFPLTRVTLGRLKEYGVKIDSVELIEDSESDIIL
ncbi:hypothetical protein [Thermoactinomyces sp. CICC 10522]|uniref:hypothetical protein n=1 Tax=Thermoactinomyces sp. CICC 10522 TaxID=2767427 RepID=UPI0018DB5D80|nr:hypothetical protein [Thermoactinomyces sp. CICC 10522]MBH8603668.1 hypothetical protein [Thermoactinomyces sp. CICC 10522]